MGTVVCGQTPLGSDFILRLPVSLCSSSEYSSRSGSSQARSASFPLAPFVSNSVSKGKSTRPEKHSGSHSLVAPGVSFRFCCRKFLLPRSGPLSRVWLTNWVTWCLRLPLKSKPVRESRSIARLFLLIPFVPQLAENTLARRSKGRTAQKTSQITPKSRASSLESWPPT